MAAIQLFLTKVAAGIVGWWLFGPEGWRFVWKKDDQQQRHDQCDHRRCACQWPKTGCSCPIAVREDD